MITRKYFSDVESINKYLESHTNLIVINIETTEGLTFRVWFKNHG